METLTVSSTKALELQALLNLARAGRLKVGPAHHNVEASGDLLLVDPVNGDPFVFAAPSTVHVFRSKPGSGTDHLLQRIKASLCFEQLSTAA